MSVDVHCISMSLSAQDEFELKTSGIRVDWLYKNLVQQQDGGTTTFLTSIKDVAGKKIK